MACGWALIESDSGLHQIVPEDDARAHDLTHEIDHEGMLIVECWCKPCFANDCIIHHSADGREKDEPETHVCNFTIH
jgi:hypothetical protein